MCKGLVCLADPGGELLRGAPAGGPVYSRRPGRPGLWTAGGRQERDVAGGRGRYYKKSENAKRSHFVLIIYILLGQSANASRSHFFYNSGHAHLLMTRGVWEGLGGPARPQVKCTYTNRISDAPGPEHLTVSICASRRDPALPAAGVHRHPVVTRGLSVKGRDSFPNPGLPPSP
uniref:Uncharacterized protein n=3 Tax=Human herpesvirus 1 TaxID=10298 RepID=A0A2U9A9J5_HHV1|nr:hypothetical protein [Human alphaherpesvirus 1]AWO71129.1 hypothetical protein [Human alphaherpesvirus 1]AWW08300.1 hypothetical protein [Human alphaherpesvirus 1]AWW08390.1 hypothetical protein [Human alphaherpesvirus 1]AWW09118.1 hypothetical protein [Human alphaherpesvirus 1]